MTLETSYLKESEKDFKTYGKSLLIKLDSQPDEALKALNSLFLDTIRKVERVLRAANIESFAYNHRVNFLLSSLALSNISLSLAYRHLLSNPSRKKYMALYSIKNRYFFSFLILYFLIPNEIKN